MKTITFLKEAKERLDKFLVSELPDLSRSQIQKMIKNRLILVNGQSAEPHHFLKEDDKIGITNEKKGPARGSSQPAWLGSACGRQSGKQLIVPEIINETDDYLVINKPAGLTVHPVEHTEKDEATLIDWLVKKYPKIKNVGDHAYRLPDGKAGQARNPLRPGLVHRLDKKVSGLMVIAKNQKMFEHLKEQFKKRQTLKEYLTLVYGKIAAVEGEIDFPIIRAKHSGKMAAQPKGYEGKIALTKFTVLKKFSNYTYLQITLLSGRTHQIRIHLHAYGHPLVGDPLYQQKQFKDKLNLNRIFLHAYRLGFNDLANHWQEFQAPLPNELNNILTALK